MAGTPISKLSGAFTTYAAGNLLVTVDVTDPTMAPAGTDKKITIGSLLSNYSVVTLPGSLSISTLGTVTAGTWNGTAIAPAYLTAMGASGGSHSAGIVPDPGSSAGSSRFLREDATWTADQSASTVLATGSTTSRTLASRYAEVYNAKDYGATGNGTTDDTSAITATIAAAPAGSIVLVPPGTYKITSTITITKTLHWRSYGATFVYSGAAGAKVFYIHGPSGSSINGGTIEGLAVKNSAMDWTGGTKGIWLENLYYWTADALYVENFQYGIVVSGISFGCVYCDIRLQGLINNLINFSSNQNSAGWTNELIVRGGHWLIDTSTAHTLIGWTGASNAAHVSLDLTGGAAWGLEPDHITFDGCSFEGNTNFGTVYVANLGNVSNILFLSCRNESTGNPQSYNLANANGSETQGSQDVWVLGGTAYQTGNSGSFWTDPNGGTSGCIYQQEPNNITGNAKFKSLSVTGNAIYATSTYCPCMSLEQSGTLASSNVSSVAIYTRDVTLGSFDAASPVLKINDTTAASGALFQAIKQTNTIFMVGTSSVTIGTLNGLLKGTTGVVSAAVAGTDYLTPTGSGTGLSGVALLASANSFSAAQTITGSTDTVQLIVKGNSTQTNHLQDWKNTSNAVVASMNNAGSLSCLSITCVGSGYNSFNTGDSSSRLVVNSSGAFQWGSGSAAADVGLSRSAAGVLAVTSVGTGAGVLKAPLAGPLASKSGAYLATTQDRVILCTASAGWALTLPAASSTPAGFELVVKKTDNNANAITVTPNGTDKIDGAGTYALSAQYKFVYIICDGSANWYIAGSN